MKVKLTKEARIKHSPGDVVDVSPAVYSFLASIGAAVPVADGAVKKKRTTKK